MRLLSLTSALVFAISGLCAQNREVLDEFKIGVVGRDSEDAIYQAAHLGAIDAARDLGQRLSIDVEVLVMTPATRQGESQPNSLGLLFVEDADGLIISPADPERIRPAIEFARRQGQAVIFFEESVPGVHPLASVIADEVEAGRLAARAILPKLPTRGRVAILTAESPGPALRQRLEGVRDVLGYRRIQTIVETAPDYRAAIEAIGRTQENDREDAIMGWIFLDDWPLLGLPAFPWQPGDLPCVAIQSSPSAFIYIDRGYLDALVVHPYYEWGYAAMEILVNKLYRGTDPENPVLLTEPRVVDWRNVAQYREDWKTWLK